MSFNLKTSGGLNIRIRLSKPTTRYWRRARQNKDRPSLTSGKGESSEMPYLRTGWDCLKWIDDWVRVKMKRHPIEMTNTSRTPPFKSLSSPSVPEYSRIGALAIGAPLRKGVSNTGLLLRKR